MRKLVGNLIFQRRKHHDIANHSEATEPGATIPAASTDRRHAMIQGKIRISFLMTMLLSVAAVVMFASLLLAFSRVSISLTEQSERLAAVSQRTANMITTARHERTAERVEQMQRAQGSLALAGDEIRDKLANLVETARVDGFIASFTDSILGYLEQFGFVDLPMAARHDRHGFLYQQFKETIELTMDDIAYANEAGTPSDFTGRLNDLIVYYETTTNARLIAYNSSISARLGSYNQVISLLGWACVAFFVGIVGLIFAIVYRPTEKVIMEALAQLRREQKRAEAADMAKSEFLANMSHEIRTPMNGVMGMAELLANTELNAKQKMFTDVIVKSGASLLTIINDILDFSKIDAGQMELDLAPFNLAEAIEDVSTLVSSRVAEKDLELIVRVDPKLPKMVTGDVGRIRQIVTNLMGNAVKFTEQGHVFVNVTPAAAAPMSGDEVAHTTRFRVSIEDTGIGIPQKDLQKVFDKFSQVDTSATRKHEGTGLGLSIASSLVRLMNGEFGVESVYGEGSTFWFEIELAVHEAETRERIPVDVTGSRILIIDDNAVNREILSEQMATWQFDHAAASNGEEGIALMKAAMRAGIPVDCIILDYHMPGMNGGDVVQAMRAEAMIANIPVIMLTSVEETAEGKAFSSLGIQAHLTKPTRSALLLETLIGVLEDARANKGAAVHAVGEVEPALPTSSQSLPHPAQRVEREATPPAVSKHTTQAGELDVLVCEDNQVNQIVVSQILQHAGVSYRIANNGKEGLSLFEKLSPSLVLMDVSMPQMNGLDATRAIREIEAKQDRHTPIIAITAHAIKGDMERCLEAGMDDYISKPVSPDALEAKIRKWLSADGRMRNASSA